MFRIGEFSKLAMVSVRMLRHYDEIGLLTPDTVDPYTGYRYYSASQLAVIGRIQLLKEMGISLSQITKMLELLDQPQKLESFLQMRHLELQQQQQQLSCQLSLVQSAIERLRKEQTMKQFHVEKKTFPQMKVACLRKVLPTYADEHQLWTQMNHAFQLLGPGKKMFENKCAMAVFFDEGFREQDVDVEIRVQLSDDFIIDQPPVNEVCFGILPPVTAATVMLNGSYDQIGHVYEEIAQWVEEHHFQMQGPMFNIYHVSPAMDPNPDNWVTEVCVPLKAE